MARLLLFVYVVIKLKYNSDEVMFPAWDPGGRGSWARENMAAPNATGNLCGQNMVTSPHRRSVLHKLASNIQELSIILREA